MATKQKFKLVNKLKNKKEFNKYKNIIIEQVNYFIEDFNDINLTIIVREKIKNCKFAPTDVGGGFIMKNNKYYIEIYKNTLNGVDHLGKLFLRLALHHEFTHLYTLHRSLKNPNLTLNNSTDNIKTLKQFYIELGFKFWTEAEAYAVTLCKFNHICHDTPTFYTLSKDFSKILNFVTEIEDSNKKEFFKLVPKLYPKLTVFMYDCSVLVAYIVTNKYHKKYKYSESTLNNPVFKHIVTFIYNMTHLMQKFDHGTFGKHQECRLEKMGKLICEYIYEMCNIYVVKIKNNYKLCYDEQLEEKD